MAGIQILPEILSNKIAAGEVVERPASVVKELLENAIDAKSDRIHIDVEQGGRSLIRISDNGCGMNHDDALLAIERYATSKITSESDLKDIRTLGFRGEALPSIAAVSKFTLTSRDASSDAATEIYVEGGKIRSVHPTGAPPGTMMSIRQLFFNTPARRKFLKTVATEMSHIADTVSCIALARPDISFRLTHNGKTVKDWPKIGNPIDRITDILGGEARRRLYEISNADDALSIEGWIGDPSVTRSTTGKIYIFVNGRFIRDRGIVYALMDGYRGRLMKGRFPVAVLYLDLAAGEVDVNVHPTKHEVRFLRQKEVYGAIRRTVGEVWSSRKTATEKKPSDCDLPVFDRESDISREIPQDRGTVSSAKEPVGIYSPAARSNKTASSADAPMNPASEKQAEETPPAPDPPALFEIPELADLSIIGQFRNTYILCEKGDDLLLIDQHAAHERILFERFARVRQSATVPTVQKLLLPETIELGYRESAVLEPMIPELNALGIEIEPFGGNTFVVKAVPEALAYQEIRPLITELAETVDASGYSKGLSAALDACIIVMACHGAIRAHQKLSAAEMKAIVEQLDRCDNPHTCPHGRPTLIRWSARFLEKSFKRIV